MTLHISNNEPLSKYTSLQVGGDANNFVEVASEAQLEQAVTYAHTNALPITVLGGGTNVLVSDEGVGGLVIKIGSKGIEVSESGLSNGQILLAVEAGEVLDDVVAYAVTNGYWGLENLSHIPGTVGAAPVQNVGAYGVEVQNIIHSVRVYDTQTLTFKNLTNEECLFEYRDSLFKKTAGKEYIVTSVVFALQTIPTPMLTYKDLQTRFEDTTPSLTEIRQAVIEIRSGKFPDWREVGTAGSFFKNPVVSNVKYDELRLQYPELPSFPVDENSVKIPLGWILDKVLDIKGAGTSTVGAYKGQALVLINKGGATTKDFALFADEIIKRVYEEIGIEIQWEVTKLGY